MRPEDPNPITPNHFILGRPNTTSTVGEMDPKSICSRKQWRVQQQLMRRFWVRWINDYLPELTRRTKYYPETRPIEPGDLVLICDANQARGQWLCGRVEHVNIGTDGRIRTAEIRTTTGLMRRPVSKLAKLDVERNESPIGELMGPVMSPSID